MERERERYEMFLSFLTTLALILNASNSSFLSPIDGLGQIHSIHIPESLMAVGISPPYHLRRLLQTKVLVLELLMTQVCKLIQLKPIVAHLLVGLIDMLQVIFEHMESMQLLFDASIGLAVFRQPLLEELEQPVLGC